jgi:hypothetical protein
MSKNKNTTYKTDCFTMHRKKYIVATDGILKRKNLELTT